jgi:hypothetical protein
MVMYAPTSPSYFRDEQAVRPNRQGRSMTAHKRSAKIRFDMVVKILLIGKKFGLGAQGANMYPYIINYFI